MIDILSNKIVRIIICLLVMIACMVGFGVYASNNDLTLVKVIYSDGHESTITTTKSNVAEALKQAQIIVNHDEYTVPSLDSNIDITRTITIRKNIDGHIVVAEEVENVSKEEILGKYVTITEKIVVEQEEIPFETITKDISTSEEEAEERVVQEGENGLKELTYKIKYQNETEIERTLINEEIIKDPVDRIVQVANRVVSRSGGARGLTFASTSQWSYSAEEMDLICAITAQEDSTSYEGALAVITTACNRAENKGTDPLTEYKRKGQFCYTIDNYWRRRLNGNYASYVEQAVVDALNGARNHNYTSFRASGSGERIGDNVYR